MSTQAERTALVAELRTMRLPECEADLEALRQAATIIEELQRDNANLSENLERVQNHLKVMAGENAELRKALDFYALANPWQKA